jgi:transposase
MIVEVNDDPMPWRLQLWLQTVLARSERVSDQVASTLASERWSLDRKLVAILVFTDPCDLTRALHWDEPPA